MPIRIAINGFGRIARCLARIIFTEGMDLEVVVMNSRSTADTLAHLLKYDSLHGIFPGVVEAEPGKLLINGRQVTILQMEALPEELPWRDLGVQLVLEATGESFGPEARFFEMASLLPDTSGRERKKSSSPVPARKWTARLCSE